MQFNVINENYNPKKWKYAQKPLSSFQLFKCLVFVTISDSIILQNNDRKSQFKQCIRIF